jgi:DNA polymerase IV
MLALPEHGFRRVMHCDLDSFFASVEELDDPSLAGKPVIVGGNPDGRGVVSTANYVARRYGVHSAMSAALARRLCPQAIFLRPRFERYRALSEQVMRVLDDYFVVREQVSIDEAYGELAPGLPGCRRAEDIARELKGRVRAEVGLVISVGVGSSKSIAKLASDVSKPDGCLVVRPGTEAAFLRPLSVGRISGVGPHTRERLERLGLTAVGQLADADPELLRQHFGKHGQYLWHLANGHDDRPVVSEHGPPKSVSSERTYERDVNDLERAAEHTRELAVSVARRAVREDVRGRTVVLKVKWSTFHTITRQRPLARPTNDVADITEAALALLTAEVAPALQSGAAIRLLGVGLHSIVAPRAVLPPSGLIQLRLFEDDPLASAS